MAVKDSQFIRYHAMVSQLASQGLQQGMHDTLPNQMWHGQAVALDGLPVAASPGSTSHHGQTAPSSGLPVPHNSLAAALPAASLLLHDDASQHEPLVQAMRDVAATKTLTDWVGHSRPYYHPFAVHLCLAAFGRRYETISPTAWSRCEEIIPALVAPLRGAEHFADAVPPDEFIPLVLWQALGLAQQATLLSRDIDLEMTDSLVAAIVASPTDDGALHRMSPDESLDGWTYSELVGLHALARLALLRRNQAWAKQVEEIALFHLENTQPDNATNQPWGLFAFLWSGKTRSFADQQLHDVTAHSGGHITPLAGMLLADAADCLFEFV